MTVSAQYVAEHFDDVAAAVDRGEVVEISRGEQRALRIVPAPLEPAQEVSGTRVLGAGTMTPAIRHLLDNWDEIDREWNEEIENNPIFPGTTA